MWEKDDGIDYVFIVFLVTAGLLFFIWCAACLLIGCKCVKDPSVPEPV